MEISGVWKTVLRGYTPSILQMKPVNYLSHYRWVHKPTTNQWTISHTTGQCANQPQTSELSLTLQVSAQTNHKPVQNVLIFVSFYVLPLVADFPTYFLISQCCFRSLWRRMINHVKVDILCVFMALGYIKFGYSETRDCAYVSWNSCTQTNINWTIQNNSWLLKKLYLPLVGTIFFTFTMFHPYTHKEKHWIMELY